MFATPALLGKGTPTTRFC